MSAKRDYFAGLSLFWILWSLVVIWGAPIGLLFVGMALAFALPAAGKLQRRHQARRTRALREAYVPVVPSFQSHAAKEPDALFEHDPLEQELMIGPGSHYAAAQETIDKIDRQLRLDEDERKRKEEIRLRFQRDMAELARRAALSPEERKREDDWAAFGGPPAPMTEEEIEEARTAQDNVVYLYSRPRVKPIRTSQAAEMLWERIPGWTEQDSQRAKDLLQKTDWRHGRLILIQQALANGVISPETAADLLRRVTEGIDPQAGSWP